MASILNKKILFLSRPFPEQITGTGEQVVSKNIFDILIKNGYKVRFVKPCLGINPYKSILSLLLYDWVLIPFLVVKSIFWKPKIVFFASPFQTIPILFVKLFYKKSSTLILVHDLFFIDYNKSLFDVYAGFIYQYAIKFADCIVTTTEENSRKLYNKFKRNSDVIWLGAGEDFDNFEFKNKEIKNNFGYIGAYTERKRVDFIIDLLKYNSDEIINFHFAGIIPDNFKEEVEKIKGENKIFYYGNIKENEKLNFYLKLDYLYFPTKIEGFGLPILEAMKTGVLPIVHEDAKIPNCLRQHCKIMKNNEIINLFKIIKYEKKEIKERLIINYKYSKQFSYKNYFNYFEKFLN